MKPEDVTDEMRWRFDDACEELGAIADREIIAEAVNAAGAVVLTEEERVSLGNALVAVHRQSATAQLCRNTSAMHRWGQDHARIRNLLARTAPAAEGERTNQHQTGHSDE